MVVEDRISPLVLGYCIKNLELKEWFNTTIMYPPSKKRTYFVNYINNRFHKIPMIHNVIALMDHERSRIENYLQEQQKNV